MNTSYAMTRLRQSCAENGPLCVGLDTDPSYIPPEVLRMYQSPAEAVLAYNRGIIGAVKGNAGCCKVQIAYYEAMGLDGLRVYAETLRAVREAGLPVIADIKRGDIADTAKAYARAHFSGIFEADIVTIHPFMGYDALEAFIEWPRNAGKGIFVLLRTSNPGMKDIEWQQLADGRRLVDAVGEKLAAVAAQFEPDNADAAPCAPVGAVVGCTEESDAQQLRGAYPGLFFLIPGYGAQGGTARVASVLLRKAGGTVNSSRGILTAWKKSESLCLRRSAGSLTMNDITDAAGQAAFAAKAELLAACRLSPGDTDR